MRTSLRIGEVARLLGISAKTIRHYHTIGLLAEPERTPARYRLYTASDVLRLLRIRHLQALGLSLAQIKMLLRMPEEEDSLRRVLAQIAAEIDDQLRDLELRRQQITALLARDSLDALERPSRVPPILALAQERLAEHGIVPDDAVWKQDLAIFGALDALHLPEWERQQLHEVVGRVLDDPERIRCIVTIGERFAALAGVPADSPHVDRLVEEALESNWLAQLQGTPFSTSGSADSKDVLGMLLSEFTMMALSPAQQRFLERMQAQQPDRP